MSDRELTYPDGLAPDHAERPGWIHRHANLLSLVVLGALMALALSGLLAGGGSPTRSARGAAADLSVKAPATLRNGEFFEMRIAVTAHAPIAKLTVAVAPALWRDMTVNTMVPAAGEESFAGGAFRFDYGALKPGDAIEVKIDGQINPPLLLGTKGTIAILDGDRQLATLPVAIRVLP